MSPVATSTRIPTPTRGASLILAFRSQRQRILIIGSGLLAASRVFAALEADFEVVVLAEGGLDGACPEIQWRVESQECTFVDWDDQLQGPDKLNSFLISSPPFSLACITDTVIGPSYHPRRTTASATTLYHTLKSHRISVNTSDIPDLCDFTFASTHRLEDHETGERSPLQVGVTTNGQGCRLASRIRRDIVANLPKDIGRAATNLGKLRQMAKGCSAASAPTATPETLDLDLEMLDVGEVNDDSGLTSTPNHPVPIRGPTETTLESIRRRMKWVAQLSEYWPISKIADMSQDDMKQVLLGDKNDNSGDTKSLAMDFSRHHNLNSNDDGHQGRGSSGGRILLVGSGPGHPSLLTVAAHTALTKLADLVLSDKLVPNAILSLIPDTIPTHIARKFPGNADGAQQEMMEAAIEAANRGLTVVRLKQGDPVIYGRAGEEILYFRKHGYEPLLIPGISSSIAAPTFAGIPITQRGVADSFIVCTGVGRNGRQVQLPGYERSRTLIVLMGVARIRQVVDSLLFSISNSSSSSSAEKKKRQKGRAGKVYPKNTPIAIIERASMPDQRVLTSTLENVVMALESCGEQRPPGLMVIGWAVLAMWGEGNVDVLSSVEKEDDDDEGEDEDEDEEVGLCDERRVKRWLGDQSWRVREGIDETWKALVV